ncbi:MAG: RNA polymerase sigma factor [Bacteroidales bacterium]
MKQQEQEFIAGCRKGSRGAQEGLYRHYYAFGMSVCLRYAACREDALEVLNDSFMKVFDNIRQYDSTRPFRSWFRRILVNTALDHYRAQRNHRLQVSLEVDTMDVDMEPDYYQKLSAGEILELLVRLPETYRITFNLYEVEGYSHDEIAGMLDISPGTSRSNLHRAKKMLQRLYIERENDNQCYEAV